ncbi:MAG: hypothetical protein MRJ93_10340 [Nitrososphaeraceae archaeon]|nr:hypothetical protein [Nitrososphaeraceae archaeon]
MQNNKLISISLLSTLSILLVAVTSLTIPVYAQENIIDSKQPKFFAIQHAQSASISKVNATTNFLELHDVSNPILFSDRPDRIVKTESTQQFLDRWYDAGTDTKNNSFFSDPPNAALVIDDQEGQDEVVIELFEPAYDYDSDVLVYNFNYLNNTVGKLPSEFGQATLVIDSTFANATPGDY